MQVSSQQWHRKHLHRWDTLVSSLIILVLIATITKDSSTLKISSIEIPAAVWNGSQVTLVCNYELAPDEQLYSIKWYKDYVEFYRFQPQSLDQSGNFGGQHQTGITQSGASSWDQNPEFADSLRPVQNVNLNQDSGDVTATTASTITTITMPSTTNARSSFEFELDGINLDLTKSNATHVHLRQVSLSSEATFKCEVSADSPTFATVSAERQMKIYVLAKQKLSLVDNSIDVQQQQQTPPSTTTRPDRRNNESLQMQMARPSQGVVSQQSEIYQLNDLLNFTCHADASRPGAKLNWFLNDEPVLLTSKEGGNRSRISDPNLSEQGHFLAPLSALDIDDQMRQITNDLVESRSTLIFRFQAHHLRRLRKQQTNSNHKHGQQLAQSMVQPNTNAILPIKLTCLSRLSVEFSSETSVLVSNGKTSTKSANNKRRNLASGASKKEDDQKQTLPVASSLKDTSRSTGSRSKFLNEPDFYGSEGQLQEDRVEVEEIENRLQFRWPPLAPRARLTQTVRQTSDPLDGANYSADRPGISTSLNEQDANQNWKRQTIRSSRYGGTVWTNRQLRSQSEFISKLIRKSCANELEAPHIEAKSIESNVRLYGPSNGTRPTSSRFQDARPTKLDESNDEDELDDRIDAFSSPSIVIPGEQFAGSNHQFQQANRDLNKDYELNERVNFTCHPVVAGEAQQLNQNGRMTNRPSLSIQIKWFINNQEIKNLNWIDAFDGNRFYSTQSGSFGDVSSHYKNHTTNETADQNVNLNKWRQSTRNHDVDRTLTSSWLLIEFTSSLLQLKEFNLKCKTIVVQPLIEHESSQILSLATSPFIQVVQDQHQNQRSQARPSMYNVRDQQQRQSAAARYQSSVGLNNYDYNNNQPINGQRGQRINVIRMRQSQQQPRSHSVRTINQINLIILIYCLLMNLQVQLWIAC